VSWQLGALLVLGLALAGGFGWYERGRPDARIVALVATLAAFAALGRIAFAAVPNVKPTTDIVLISGYALGGAPGFVVGAVAGLTSNFFFGQGPWTPWQMAAWGLTGMFGAGLAAVTRGRISRWPLALVCTVIGFLFTAVQDVGDWVTYSDHSSAQLATYLGTGLGFDVIDAGGCLVFALAFGPALLRSVQRFARRLQVQWGPPASVAPILLVCVCGLLAFAPAAPKARAASAAGSPLAYLLGAQNPDGGFGAGPGQPSGALYSGWAALALAADGRNPADVRRGAHSLLAYLEATVPGDPGSLERTILVARAAGVPATDFGGHDLLAALKRDIGRSGAVAGKVDLTTFGVLALRAAGVVPPARMLGWLVRQQNHDGGFSFATAGDLPDVDDTGAALEALGDSAPATRRRAVAFILGAQNRDGGFPSQPGGTSNAQSTAWAVQGLIAAGVSPAGIRTHGSPTPIAYLRSLITPSGAIDYARGVSQTPVWVSAEAIVALEGKPFPLAGVPAAARTHARAHARTPARRSRAPHRALHRHRAGHRRRSARRSTPRSPAGGQRRVAGRSSAGGAPAGSRHGSSSLAPALGGGIGGACVLTILGWLLWRGRRRSRVAQ
jgi:energy-coupling factor transport system substrate-specific component